MGKAQYGVAITAKIVKDGKFLIVKRSRNEKRFPGIWTVPGGRLEPEDYQDLPKDTENAWYGVLENTLKREVKQEVGLEIDNIRYLLSLMADYGGGVHSLVIACVADYKSGKVKLQPDELEEFAWVTVEEAKKYQMIDGIWDEMVMAQNMIDGKTVEWKGK